MASSIGYSNKSQAKILSVEITDGPGPLPHGVFEQAPRVIATLDDGSRVELFSFYATERSFSPAEFVGLSVAEGRELKFASSGERWKRADAMTVPATTLLI